MCPLELHNWQIRSIDAGGVRNWLPRDEPRTPRLKLGNTCGRGENAGLEE